MNDLKWKIVEEVEGQEDIILESGLAFEQAEKALSWHCFNDADAYMQEDV